MPAVGHWDAAAVNLFPMQRPIVHSRLSELVVTLQTVTLRLDESRQEQCKKNRWKQKEIDEIQSRAYVVSRLGNFFHFSGREQSASTPMGVSKLQDRVTRKNRACSLLTRRMRPPRHPNADYWDHLRNEVRRRPARSLVSVMSVRRVYNLALPP
jgi:hypothetical protein